MITLSRPDSPVWSQLSRVEVTAPPAQNQSVVTVSARNGLASVFSSWHSVVHHGCAGCGCRQSAGVTDAMLR